MHIRFNNKQTEKLSDVSANIGLLLLASMSIPVFSRSKEITLSIFISGIIAFLVFLTESMILLGGVGNE